MDNPQVGSILAKKLNTYLLLTPGELSALAKLQSTKLTVKRGKQLIHEGQREHQVFVLQAGWGAVIRTSPTATVRSFGFRYPGTL